MTIDKNHMP